MPDDIGYTRLHSVQVRSPSRISVSLPSISVSINFPLHTGQQIMSSIRRFMDYSSDLMSMMCDWSGTVEMIPTGFPVSASILSMKASTLGVSFAYSVAP